MKVLTLIIFIVLFVICNNNVTGPGPNTLWEKTYGGADRDQGRSVQQTSDGGFIVAGYTRSYGEGWHDVYLIRTNSIGSILWSKTYGGVDHDEGHAVQHTTDGGFIIAGETYSFGAGYSDVYLIKTDTNGDTLWTRIYGGTNYDIGYSVQQTNDGGFIIGGVIDMTDIYMIRTNSTGDTLWTRSYGWLLGDEGRSIIQTNDGGFAFVGSKQISRLDRDVYLIRTNSNGDSLWTKTYKRGYIGNSIQQTSDGGFIIAGNAAIDSISRGDVCLIRIDSNGDTLWTRTYDEKDDEGCYSVKQTSDNGFIVGGWKGYGAYFLSDAFLIRTNSNGDFLWSKTYGGSENDEILSVQQTSDGGFIAAGYTRSFGSGSSDFYLIRLCSEDYF